MARIRWLSRLVDGVPGRERAELADGSAAARPLRESIGPWPFLNGFKPGRSAHPGDRSAGIEPADGGIFTDTGKLRQARSCLSVQRNGHSRRRNPHHGWDKLDLRTDDPDYPR